MVHIAPSHWGFTQQGKAGRWVGDLLPWTGKMVDDLALVYSLKTDAINHEPAILQEEFNYVPTYKIWLVTNYKPRIVGTDEAVWSRVHFVGWNRFYQSSERDPKLQEKLDSNLPAILNWMVEGCLEWQKQGLNPPASMLEDMNKYRKEQDTIGRFVEDEFIIGDEHRTPKREAYNCYKRWAEDAGEHYVLTQAEFNEKMQERFQEGRSSGSRFWKGFRLKHETDETIARLGTSYSELEKAIQ